MYYVYCYYNPLKIVDGHPEPFYIGKGKNKRAFMHLYESKLTRDPNKHKVNTIRSILTHGQQPIIKILKMFQAEIEALEYEVHLISSIGRKDLATGPLVNMTDGGEGASNRVVSNETRKKLSQSTKNAIADGKLSANIARFSMSMKGKKQSADHVKKRTACRIGTNLKAETKAKISDAHRKIRSTEEWKAKASLAQKGKRHSLGHVLKCIENNPRSRPVEILGQYFPSIGQAIKATGLTPGKVRSHPTFKLL